MKQVRCKKCGTRFQLRSVTAGTKAVCPNTSCRQKYSIRKRGKSKKRDAGLWSAVGALALALVVAAVFLLPRSHQDAKVVAAEQAPQRLDYDHDVKPFLQQYCADCHGTDFAESELNFASYETTDDIKRDRDKWVKVFKLLKVGAMPPSDSDQPDAKMRSKIVEWLDHELFYVDCTNPDPGRVTIRRLNKTEYNNTIRDLLGVDFEPAKDFPSDDVGYGFDNIGDVLTVPPLLIEKYLDAADQIAQKAIPVSHPQHILKHVPAKDLQKEGSVGPGPYDTLSFPSRGTGFSEFQIPGDGRYTLRFTAAATQAGEEGAKMQVTIGDQEIKTFEIKKHKEPVDLEVTTAIKKGKHRIACSFINDFYDPDNEDPQRRDRNLLLKFIEVEGPIDLPNTTPLAQELIATTPSDQLTAKQAAMKNLESFLPRAFRRPVTKDEVSRFAEFAAMATENGDSFRASMRVVLQAILVSSDFLFRVEGGRRLDGTMETIDDHALASRLSYFIWSSMPDDELLDLARQNKLHEPEILKQQTNRLLKDPKAEALIQNFPGQWLGLRKLTTNEIEPDAKLFPEFTEQIRLDLWKETELFFGSVVQDDSSIYDLLNGQYTFLNKRLSEFYGLGDVKGDKFQRVSLEGTPRKGVLTQGSILTLTSYPTRTSPVRRGQWVLENLLGDAPPEPPPIVPALEETQAANPNLSFREQLELHRSDPGCASCHKLMDDMGFGLENFDAIGRWREESGGHPVDSQGTLPSGESFSGPMELLGILSSRKEQFGRCLTERLLTYAIGRGVEYYDKCAIDSIMARIEKDDRFSSLVFAIVESAPFQLRKVDDTGRP